MSETLNELQSEIARLMQRIDAEVQAGRWAIYGAAEGTTKHKIITKRMENIGAYEGELQALIGDKAIPLIIDKIGQLAQPYVSPQQQAGQA